MIRSSSSISNVKKGGRVDLNTQGHNENAGFKPKLRLLGVIILGVLLLSSCGIPLPSVPGLPNFAGTLPVDTALRQKHSLSGQTATACLYSAQSYASDRTVIKTIVYGLGDRPNKVEVTRNASETTTSLLPSITAGPTIDVATGDGWTAFGNGLNCSINGCGTASYTVLVEYSDVISACPPQISLEVDIPAN